MLKRASFYFSEVAFKVAVRKKIAVGKTNIGIWRKNNVTDVIPRKASKCREKKAVTSLEWQNLLQLTTTI